MGAHPVIDGHRSDHEPCIAVGEQSTNSPQVLPECIWINAGILKVIDMRSEIGDVIIIEAEEGELSVGFVSRSQHQLSGGLCDQHGARTLAHPHHLGGRIGASSALPCLIGSELGGPIERAASKNKSGEEIAIGH
jgi:hypothetical protein